jgi:hypothetical protein
MSSLTPNSDLIINVPLIIDKTIRIKIKRINTVALLSYSTDSQTEGYNFTSGTSVKNHSK